MILLAELRFFPMGAGGLQNEVILAFGLSAGSEKIFPTKHELI
jgi:hypothetical protein